MRHPPTVAGMTSSGPEHPTYATGAFHPHRRAPRAVDDTLVQRPPVRYEPFLDGLFTYCLSVLCEHDSATSVLGEALALAERRADRAPADEEMRRPWMYALARWACLRRLAERGAKVADSVPTGSLAAHRRAELSLLAWPEAAGTTPEQREALELAVRHGLTPHEVGVVLRLDPDATRALLSSAACEVERTRTALAVVESGRCPVVARFAGDTEMLLGAALRRELVRHVDDCADCRRTAERANAGDPWPGTSASTAALPVLEAPRAAAHAAMLCALAARPQRAAPAGVMPRFDRKGFPLAPKDRAARRGRLRSRAVTTTVVATVVAAPVLALWAAYRGGPGIGEGQDTASVSARETDGLGRIPYEEVGRSHTSTDARSAVRRRPSDVSVAVLGPDGRPVPVAAAATASPAPGDSTRPLPAPSGPGHGPGRLTVEAQPSGGTTLITLTADGGQPVRWSMTADAPWLRLNRVGGVLTPGQSVTVTVYVDQDREPVGHWTARVAVAPGGSVVTIEGRGAAPEPTPAATQPPPSPTAPPPAPSPSATN
ncbi:hypothetical protein SNS2_1919 [Streptomyces netropsis]|nr:hypothetical protein SNS2_1919 [Streptomyces netropsis]